MRIISPYDIAEYPIDSKEIVQSKTPIQQSNSLIIQLIINVIKEVHLTQTRINRVLIRSEFLKTIDKCKRQMILDGYNIIDLYTKTTDALFLLDDWYVNIYLNILPYNGITNLKLIIPLSNQDIFQDHLDLVLIDNNEKVHLIEIVDWNNAKPYQKTNRYINARLWALYTLSGVVPETYRTLSVRDNYISISTSNINRHKIFNSFKGTEYLIYGIMQKVIF